MQLSRSQQNTEYSLIFSHLGKMIEGTLSQMIEKSSSNESEFLSYTEACELFKISRITLRRWIKKGKLKPISLSPKKNYFKRSEIMNFIESSQSQTVEG